jgi:hypothetical protein
MTNDDLEQSIDSTINCNVTRRDFIKVSAGTVACISLSPVLFGCGSSTPVAGYPIDSTVVKTTERMITFPYLQPIPPLSTGMPA